ncbi:hypothetical protein QAD02_020969 [Eretmocerus hayati]|uniref:Uncharacterized protein n=1 Tax=Eretmocerus hayati TaxID=131215 RepID=A0ACC2PNV8_9HYME|nr:hypothetical protein QAD02_020969 [Eretmocerus hayati]
MNVDSRGVKRGRCNTDGCDCEIFERDERKLAACGYCFCAPTKHSRIAADADNAIASNRGDDSHKGGLEGHGKDSLEKPLVTSTPNASIHEQHEFCRGEEMEISPDDIAVDGLPITEEDLRRLSIVLPPSPSSESGDPLASNDLGSSTLRVINISQENSSRMSDDPSRNEQLPGISDASQEDNSQNSIVLSGKERSTRRPFERALRENSQLEAAKEQAIKNCWPKSWPSDIAKVREQKIVSSDIRRKIIRLTKQRLEQENFTTAKDFDIAAKLLTQDFQCFDSIAKCGHAHVAMLLRKCQSNAKNYLKVKSKKKSKSSSMHTLANPDESTCEMDVEELMREELSKARPSTPKLKRYLDLSREKRLNKINNGKMTASAVLQVYPAFKIPELVFYEFERVFGISRIKLEENWTEVLPRMKQEFSLKSSLDEIDLLTIETLHALCQKLCKRKKQHPQCMLRVYDASTPLASITPNTDLAPYLIGVGDINKKDLSFAFYVDSVSMYSGQAVDALVAMYCYYWVFNLNYTAGSQLPFLCVEAILFREKAVSPIENKASVVNLLADLQIASS